MKSLIRNTTFYALSLYVLTLTFNGIKLDGGFITYVTAGIVLSILFTVLKPILGLISLPLNLVTLGLFSFFINSIILFLATIIVPGLSISPFRFNGFSWAGFVIPPHDFGAIFAYVFMAAALAILMNYFSWLSNK